MGGKNLIWYDVPGDRGAIPNTNTMELDAIAAILERLEAAGYDLKEHVGIITPYRHQVTQLKRRFAQRIGHKDRDREAIGTIHKFQGAEFEVIIFSPVIFTDGDNSGFINSKPNMLNVALSRAKHLFIVAGNSFRFEEMEGYGKKMLTHIRRHGYVVDFQPDDSKIISEDVADQTIIGEPCQHIEFFHKAVDNAQKSIVVLCPWIRSPNLAVSPQLDLLKAAHVRGVDVKIFYGWKKEKSNSDSCPELTKKYKEIFGQNLTRLENGTHAKVVIIDDKTACVGSFNWLSHPYYDYCQTGEDVSRAMLRSEISVVLSNTAEIEQLKKDFLRL